MATAKTGRKQKHHIDSKTGKPVVGLTRRPDGRWRGIGTHQTFREADEQKAIEKFRELIGEGETKAERSLKTYYKKVGFDWAAVAREIRTRPLSVAKQTGIEELGYLKKLKPPEKLPSLAELRKVWEKHATCSVEQMKKSRKGFDHFLDATETKQLEDISPVLAVEYHDVLWESGYVGKTQKHLIAGLRRVPSFAKKRAMAMEEINKALTYLELIKPSERDDNRPEAHRGCRLERILRDGERR